MNHALLRYRYHNAALLAWLAGLCLTGCTNLGEVRQSWDAAVVDIHNGSEHVSGRMGTVAVQTGLSQLPMGQHLPTIVYFHGCTGLRNTPGREVRAGTRDFWMALTRDGYAIVSPDSFARDNRRTLCGEGWIQDRVRLPEIRYAVDRIKRLNWVDPANIVLVGFSEGGSAVSLYERNDVNAVVILGNDCGLGVRFPGPSLAILSAHDHWIRQSNPCKGASERLIIDSDVHNALRFPEAQALFRRFIREHTN